MFSCGHGDFLFGLTGLECSALHQSAPRLPSCCHTGSSWYDQLQIPRLTMRLIRAQQPWCPPVGADADGFGPSDNWQFAFGI